MDNLEIIDIKNVNVENMLLHFTLSDNIFSIREKGLLPSIGKNSIGLETNPKIFFAKGVDGCAEILNIWVKWLIYKRQRTLYFKNVDSPQIYDEISREFYESLLDGSLFTGKVKKEIFEYFYEYLKNSNHLMLNLEEGKDYLENDVDEIKVRSKRSFKYIEAMYGGFSSGEGMEKWNMHTKIGVSIPPEKIKILSVDGKIDSLSVAKKLYGLVKEKEDLELPLLEEFVSFANEKEKHSKR